MITIGLAGGSGSGKGFISAKLLDNGIPSFDCDAVYHGMISHDSEVTRELISEFGPAVESNDGGIDRTALRTAVFADGAESKRKRLNEITHKHVKVACLKWLDEMRAKGCFAAIVDAPLLFESGFDAFCDFKVSVVASEEIRVNRIIIRDALTKDAALRRIRSQMNEEQLRQRSDFVIVNNGDESALSEQIRQLLNKIRSI
jgi:dephospho-CoA kinase